MKLAIVALKGKIVKGEFNVERAMEMIKHLGLRAGDRHMNGYGVYTAVPAYTYQVLVRSQTKKISSLHTCSLRSSTR